MKMTRFAVNVICFLFGVVFADIWFNVGRLTSDVEQLKAKLALVELEQKSDARKMVINEPPQTPQKFNYYSKPYYDNDPCIIPFDGFEYKPYVGETTDTTGTLEYKEQPKYKIENHFSEPYYNNEENIITSETIELLDSEGLEKLRQPKLVGIKN